MLHRVTHCKKPSGCVCVFVPEREWEYVAYMQALSKQVLLLANILQGKILSFSFPLTLLLFILSTGRVLFPSWDLCRQISHISVSLAWAQLVISVYKSDCGRVSKPVGSPENVLQWGVVQRHALFVHLCCCLFTFAMLEEKLMLVAMWCLSQQVRIGNDDPAACRLLEIVRRYDVCNYFCYFTWQHEGWK